MKIFIIAIFFLLLTWVLMSFFNDSPKLSPMSEFLYSMNEWHANEFCESEGLVRNGTGGSVPKLINFFMISYKTDRKLDVADARKLMVKLKEGMINKINSMPEQAHLFQEYPISEKNVCLQVVFKDKDSKYIQPPYVGLVCAGGYYITYETFDYSINRFKELLDERYEDAVKLVHPDRL